MNQSGPDQGRETLTGGQGGPYDKSGPAASPWPIARRNWALLLLIAYIIWPHFIFVLDFSGSDRGPLGFLVDFGSWLTLILPVATIVVWRKSWPVILVFFLAGAFMLYGHYFLESAYMHRSGLAQMDIFDWRRIMKLALTHGCDDGDSNNLEICSLATFMADAFGYYCRSLRLAVIPALLLSFGLWRLDVRETWHRPRLREIRAYFQPLTPGKLLYAVLCVIAAGLVMSPYFMFFD